MRGFVQFALLTLLCGAEAAPGIGYALQFSTRAETSSPKTRLGELDRLQAEGWTISAWLKYADLSNSVLMTDVNMVSAVDSNLMNGFGGPGVKNFVFSNSVSYSKYLKTADFMEWHHFAMSFDAPKATLTQFVDGVKVNQWSPTFSRTNHRERWADDAAFNLGLFCLHAAEGTARKCNTNRFFLGQMDDVAIFVGALSEAEMAQRWNSSLAQRLADSLEPNLAIFYDFNDPWSMPHETANLGYAGADFNLVHGRLDMTQTGDIFLDFATGTEFAIASPNVVPTVPITRKAAEPDSTPRVAYGAPGATIDLAAVLGMASGQNCTTPASFNTPEVLLDVPTAKGGTATVHIVPLAAPPPAVARWLSVSTSEDVPVMIQLLPGQGHTWNEETLRVLAHPPTRGVLYQQEVKEGRSLSRPVTMAGDVIDLSAHVLYVPEENRFGAPGERFDSFSAYFRLNGTNEGDGLPGTVYESAPFNVTIGVIPVDDIPIVRDLSLRITEDNVSGREITLPLSDAEVGQVLAGQITRLPRKGTLFAVSSSGRRKAIGARFSPFDVGSPVLRQYLSRVVAVSSFWGSNPPDSGYHPLGILGAPDCKNNQESMECSPDQAWVSDAMIFPELGTRVLFNGHTAYVRAIHAVGSTIGGSEGALDLEMHQYYKKNASAAAGNSSWQPCYMDPHEIAATYPANCTGEEEGGGLNTAFGRPALITVSRSNIDAMSAAVWSPERQGYEGDMQLTGGGMFGPQYVYSHRQSDHYRGFHPYTEFIEVAVATPVFIFGIVIGMPRGVGSIVAIRARNPLAHEGSGAEWVRMYEAKPLLSEYRKNLEEGGAYWTWAPKLCHMHFLTDTIRIEMDTSAETGTDDWSYIDAVEILGSTSIQDGALRQEAGIGSMGAWLTNGTTVTSNVKVVYVPHANMYGDDSFEYTANDCTGDISRASEPGLVSIAIDAVNDAPTLAVDAVSVATNTDGLLNFSALVADVETAASQLVIAVTALPFGTESHFYDGGTLITTLPHRLKNAFNVLSFRFDSLVGLETSQVADGELMRTTASAHVGFTATDLHGGKLTSMVQLKLTTGSSSCVATDHEITFDGEQPVCSACAPGRAARAGSSYCNICAEGYFRLTADDDVSKCIACPQFAVHCPRDTTLATMELSAGWWRASNRSAEWHWCGEGAGNVRFLLLNWLEGNSPGPANLSNAAARAICRGGAFPSDEEVGADGSCTPNHLGPLCRSCKSSYYLDDQLQCTACPKDHEPFIRVSSMVAAGLVAYVVYRLLFWYHARPMLTSAGVMLQCADACLRFLSKQLHNLNQIRLNNVFVPAFKLVIAYSQVVSAIPAVFDVQISSTHYSWLRWLDFFTFQWIVELGVIPACIGDGDLTTRTVILGLMPLGIMMALPLLTIGFDLLAAAASRALRLCRFVASSGDHICTKDRLYRSCMRALPLSVCVAFLSVNSVSNRVFAAFDCLALEIDSLSDAKASRHFVSADLKLQCDPSVAEYRRLLNWSYTLIALWPVAVPLSFAVLLLSMRRTLLQRRGTQLTRAAGFLLKEYEPPYFWWEPLVLVQRIVLTGWVQLVPRDKQLLRIIVGLLVSWTYMVLLLICKPYISIEVDIVAIISQGSLVLVFICALQLKTFDLTEPAGIALEVTGFSNKDSVSLFIILSTFSTLTAFTLAALYEVEKKGKVKVLRLIQDKQIPTLVLGSNMSYHLFLSHVWASAQDIAAIVKHKLQLLLPGISIFRDLDDLNDIGNLEAYIDASQCTLVMLTRGYFTSQNCLRELDRSLATSKPLILLHEEDLTKGGVPLSVLRTEFERRRNRAFIVGGRCRHDTRGMGTVQSYNAESGNVKVEFDDSPGNSHEYKLLEQKKLHLLEGNDLTQAAMIFERDDIIKWQRVAEFQAISMLLIAEQLLSATPNYAKKPPAARALYIPNAVHSRNLQLPPGTLVYVSMNNPGAIEIALELKDHLLNDHTRTTDHDTVARAKRTSSPILPNLAADSEVASLSPEVAATRLQSQYRGHASRRKQSLVEELSQNIAGFKELTLNMQDLVRETSSMAAALPLALAGISGAKVEAAFTTDPAGFDNCEQDSGLVAESGGLLTHMLLLLNESTFIGQVGEQLFEEVAKARMNGVEVVLAHERDVQRGGCEFVHFFETTPHMLIADGLYDKVATACLREPYRQVSLSLIAKALGAEPITLGWRKRVKRRAGNAAAQATSMHKTRVSVRQVEV